MNIFIKILFFFILDRINVRKFLQNRNILRSLNGDLSHFSDNIFNSRYGTKSIREISYTPPMFNNFFVAAYPDVYLWFQKNAMKGKINIFNKLKKLPDEDQEIYFNKAKNVFKFYRKIIIQYKKEGNKLECSIKLI